MRSKYEREQSRGRAWPSPDEMKSTKRQRTKGDRVLVVGSINVDLYQRMADGTVRFRGAPVDVTSIKGQTLPAKSFVQNPGIKPQIAKLPCKAGEEEVRLAESTLFEPQLHSPAPQPPFPNQRRRLS
jgi:hypothetical protein